MPIFSYGINHKTAPIEVREQWSFNHEQAKNVLHDLKNEGAMNEAVILSTCNRTEIYTTEFSEFALKIWLQTREIPKNLQEHAYAHRGIRAVEHLMRVASGLDSMILGEPQILGQMKQAYRLACDVGMVGKSLQQLFPTIFASSKNIRENTDISKSSVSIAYAAIQVAQRIFSNLENCHVLLIGSGEIAELVATHINEHKIKNLIIAGRNLEIVHQLSKPFNASAIRIGDIPHHIAHIDILLSMTGSALPIIGKDMMERHVKHQKRRPMLLIDLAIPRDIEPAVAELEEVYLYNIDDLEGIIQKNMKRRESAAKQAESLIKLHAEHYLKKLKLIKSSNLITQYRQKIESIRNKELQKALLELEQGKSPEETLTSFARTLSNKFMHQPTATLRKAVYDNDIELLLQAKKILEL